MRRLGAAGLSVFLVMTAVTGFSQKSTVEGRTGTRALYDEVTVDPPCNENFPKGCMVFVPGGKFDMGAQSTDPEAANYHPKAMSHESPVHERELESYWMHMREVNVEQYQRCLDRGACKIEHVNQSKGRFNFGVKGREFHPMNGISWEGAREYCSWLGGRLPTEAEWEYGSRGYEYTHYPWGNRPTTCQAVSARAAGVDCVLEGTTDDQKTQAISPFWIWDMSGSVWEWTADLYEAKAYRAPRKDRVGAPGATGPRVIRGGGWMEEDFSSLRTTHRGLQPSKLKTFDVGFRCVRDHVAAPGAEDSGSAKVVTLPVKGTQRSARVRLSVPTRFQLPVSRDNLTPVFFLYLSDSKTSFDDLEYEALLHMARERGWFFIQPELQGYRGVAPGCHPESVQEDIKGILDTLYQQLFIKRAVIHVYGRGSGGSLSAMFSRFQSWRIHSSVSEMPVYDYMSWLTHQLNHVEGEERARITSCWGDDSGSLDVFKRNKDRALKFDRGGTQRVHHLIVAPAVVKDHQHGWAADQAVDTYNWLIQGTEDYAKKLQVSRDPRLQALVRGVPDSKTLDFALGDTVTPTLFQAKQTNLQLVLLPEKEWLSVEAIFAYFDGVAP